MNYINYSNHFGVIGFHAYMSNRDNDYAKLNHRSRFVQNVGLIPDQLVIPDQIHSNSVFLVNTPGQFPKTDGIISDNKNTVLSIQVADCIPLFLFDKSSNRFGLIHLGWRGTKLGICSIAVRKMDSNLQTDIKVIIGPSIGQCCFEVGLEVASQFDFNYSIPGEGDRLMLDLRAIVRDQLISEGLNQNDILVDNQCTFCEKDRFFSYRREGNESGRMVAVAGWNQ